MVKMKIITYLKPYTVDQIEKVFFHSHKLVIWDPSLKTMITIFYESILFSGLVELFLPPYILKSN